MYNFEATINTLYQLKKYIDMGRWIEIQMLEAEDEKYSIALDNAILGLKMLEQRGWERDIATTQLHELGLGLGQKVDHVKELIDKSKPMKPNEVVGIYGISKPVCPRCGNDLFEEYCAECGQKIEF